MNLWGKGVIIVKMCSPITSIVVFIKIYIGDSKCPNPYIECVTDREKITTSNLTKNLIWRYSSNNEKM